MQMQQIMEMLAEMRADIRENQAKADTHRAEMKAMHEKTIAKLDAHQAKMDTVQDERKQEIRASQEHLKQETTPGWIPTMQG
jgi:F0F1-type ATP synthase membrane subunit b/b'